MLINVKDVVGQNAVSIVDGERIHALIHQHLERGDAVELDFDGVRVFASPFFNAGIGRLLGEISTEQLKTNLKISHLSDLGDRVLRTVLDNAKEYYDLDASKRDAIDKLMSLASQ